MKRRLERETSNKQKYVSAMGKKGEKKAREWLEKRGFEIIEWFPQAHAGYHDIKARKGKKMDNRSKDWRESLN